MKDAEESEGSVSGIDQVGLRTKDAVKEEDNQ